MPTYYELLQQERKEAPIPPKVNYSDLLKKSTEESMAVQFGQEDLPYAPPSAKVRARISLLGDTYEERKLVFERRTGGELVRDIVSQEEMFRFSPEEQFRKVDPGFLEALEQGPEAFIAEMGRDVADWAGDAPKITAEILGLYILRRPGAGQFFSDLLRLAIGGAFGETAKQQAQAIAGTQLDSVRIQADRAIGAANEAIVGGTIGQLLGITWNMVRGAGFMKIPVEARRAMAAARRQDLPQLLPSQASDIGLIKRFGRQAAALLPRITRYVTEQERRAAALLKNLSNRLTRRRLMTEAQKAHDEASNAIIDSVIKAQIGARTAGRYVQFGIAEWEKASAREVDNLYKVARSIDEPRFDLKLLDQELISVESFMEGAGPLPPTLQAVLNEISTTIRPLLQEAGQGLTYAGAQLPAKRLPSGDLLSATDQLRRWQKFLYDYTIPGVGGPREADSIARTLRNAIRKVLDNPLNEAPEFVEAWTVARTTVAKRFATREQLAIIRSVKSETPAILINRITEPGQVDNLLVLKDVLTREGVDSTRWVAVQDFYRNKLLRAGINPLLDKMDNETLNVLLPPLEIKAWREAGAKVAALKSTGIQRALTEQTQVRAFTEQLINTGDTSDLDALYKLVIDSGGKDGPFGEAFRNALMDVAYHKVTIRQQNVVRPDFNKIDALIEDWNSRGITRFLNFGELRVLYDIRQVQDYNRLIVDAGTSIEAASAAAKMRKFQTTAFILLSELFFTGRLMTNPVAQRLLLGLGKKQSDLAAVRLFGTIVDTLITDIEGQEEMGADAWEGMNMIWRGIMFVPNYIEEWYEEKKRA